MEVESASRSLAPSSKNFTTDKIQKNRNYVTEYFFFQ